MPSVQPSRKASELARKSIRLRRRSPGTRRRLMPRGFTLIVLLLAMTVGFYTFGRDKVVQIHDGDTISALNKSGRLERVRLYGVDCPEAAQPGGKAAADFTDDLAFLREARLTVLEIDRYGRTVALVRLPNGRTLNEELIRNGHAWVYRQYCKEPWCLSWLALEKEARDRKLGLWAGKNPTPPWDWREKNPRK